MNMRTWALLIFASATAVAQDEPPAHVHFYRTKRFGGSMMSPTISFDTQKVSKLANGQRFDVDVKPGKYDLHAEDGAWFIEHAMTFKPGQDYYIRLGIVGGVGTAIAGGGYHLQFFSTPEDTARTEMRDLKPVDAKKVHAPERGPLPEN